MVVSFMQYYDYKKSRIKAALNSKTKMMENYFINIIFLTLEY